MVYCGIYPADGADYENLKDALEKLRMNDASLSYEAESSAALGFGFRCGFLGLLHMEIIQQRLEREFDLNLVCTTPSVIYQVIKTNGEEIEIDNPIALPSPAEIATIKEPVVSATIYSPQEYIGTIMELCVDKRGTFIDMQYEGKRVKLNYVLPLNEVIFDFFDQIKSRSKGYASFDYELLEVGGGENRSIKAGQSIPSIERKMDKATFLCIVSRIYNDKEWKKREKVRCSRQELEQVSLTSVDRKSVV